MLQVFKLLGVNVLNLRVTDFTVLHKGEQDVCSERLDLEIELPGDLALLEALVDAPDVLPEGGVVIIFDAVVGPTVASVMNNIITYLPSNSLAMSAHLLPYTL